MAQTLTNLLVHCVFHKLTSAPHITKEDRPLLHQYLRGICANIGCQCIVANGTGDHVHLLLVLSPTVSLSALVKELKRSSTLFLKEHKNQYYRQFYWQHGYGAFSVSHKIKDAVIQYILNQEEHHTKQNIGDEFMALLKNAHVEGYIPGLYWRDDVGK
jgi:REP element-mobilizing transposase RayT